MTPAHRPVARISPVVGTNVFAEGHIFSGGVLTSPGSDGPGPLPYGFYIAGYKLDSCQ